MKRLMMNWQPDDIPKEVHEHYEREAEKRESTQQYIDVAEVIKKFNKAYRLAYNSAAGLANYCEESASVRRCERELEEADQIYQSILFEVEVLRRGR